MSFPPTRRRSRHRYRTGDTLTWTGTLSPGAAATVTYQVRVNSPDTGDRTLVNYAAPTAPGGTCATSRACTVTIRVKKGHKDCDNHGYGGRPGHSHDDEHGHPDDQAAFSH
ncbi:DUF7927 domain-containing protein [Streptomyces sp. MT206]|uniref:DUF7927 domain-containing protein n=1 Tax=Streptomyces sp. MT206 TaxID=3031407 RepID=UPI003FA6F94C